MSKFFKSNKTKAIPLSNKIYMAEWMLQRPYEKSSAYDECYVHVCNQILPIARNLIDMGAYRMSETSIETSKSLTFVLASYLEDFVSEIGLWKAFTDENKQLYGLVLPLIPLRKDYDEDDVNVEDIQYILWQFFIRATDDSLIVDPKDVNLAIFAQQIHQIFIAAIDNGKVYQTDFYKTFFRIDDKVSLINIKNQLYWIAMNSFLFTQDFSLLYKKKKEELEKKALAKTGIQIPLHLLIYAELNPFLYKNRGRFAALTTREVLARIADCSEKMRTNIRNLWQYSSGYFLTHNFVGKQEIEIQPIGMAERLIFDIRTMHERDKNMIKPKQNWIMILVKWGDSYGLSGLAGMVGGVEEANEKRLEMKKQKNTLLGYQSLMNAAYHTKLTYYQECQAMFFKAFFGSYIAFAPNQEALNSYYQQFYEWYNHEITSIIPKNDSILLSFEELTAIASEKTNTPALQAFHKKLPEITDHALVMNPEIGISLENYNLIDCVNLLKKGKINPENVADIYFCVVELPPILSSYIFEKYGFQHLKYGKSDVTTTIEQIKKDISYLQRFYQADIYNITQPNITLMDTRTLDVPLV